MITDDTLRPLLGSASDRDSMLISAPASGWRSAPKALPKRELNRLRALTQGAAERVTWAASSGKRPRYPALRQSVLSGYIWLTLASDSPVVVMRSASDFIPTDALHIGSGGGVRQRGTVHDKPAIARFGLMDSPGDPSWHYRALEEFRFGEVPEPIEHGEVHGVAWTLESFRLGHPPRHLSDGAIDQVSDFLAKLPTPLESSDLLAATASELARFSDDVEAVSERLATSFQALPSAVNHGDIWSGNLLFEDDRLVGVIDWDSWQPRGIPGIDLIHLYAEDLRRNQGISYGDLVDQSFWSSEPLTRTLARHFAKLGLSWQETLSEELAGAWWMTASTGALQRTPALADNVVWMDRNVHRPARRFG